MDEWQEMTEARREASPRAANQTGTDKGGTGG